jgi:hypothetical protein
VPGPSGQGKVQLGHAAGGIPTEGAGQLLTAAARELAPIANSPTTDFEFLKGVPLQIYSSLQGSFADDLNAGLHHVVDATPIGNRSFRYNTVFTANPSLTSN